MSTDPPSFDPRSWGGNRAPSEPSPAAAPHANQTPRVILAFTAILLAAALTWWLWPHAPIKTAAIAAPARQAAPHPVKRVAAVTSVLTRRTRVLRGEIDQQSFYTSAVAAGVDDRLISQIATAFTFDFDFVREIHPGDVFEVAVDETVDAQGNVVGVPKLLYVSLVTAAKSKELYLFRLSPQSEATWYDGDGRSTRRSLMRTPVDGAHVTSTFGMRNHPVLGYTRMHKGVDFGTPVGTPVYASGDGVVTAIGLHSGYGNYLRIEHSPTLSTAYGHLSGYPPGIAIGTHVHQGQVVALSGNTGISTGPHLHYEILIDGQQVDPLLYKVDAGVSLAGSALIAFRDARDRIDALRAKAL